MSSNKNNSSFGFTIQKTICDMYGIMPSSNRATQLFNANFDPCLSTLVAPILPEIFNTLKRMPRSCHSLEKDGNRLVPYNFTLEDNSTLSVRTNMDNDMVAPRVVGQAGFDTLNEFFGNIYGKPIRTQDDIKHLLLDSIDKILPIFIDNLLDADYILWVRLEDGGIVYDIIEGDCSFNIVMDRSRFTFTRGYDDWVESTTLKYDGISIAEVQVHKNRTFKFRFKMRNVIPLLKANQVNNETLGITAELLICGAYDLDFPREYMQRYSSIYAAGLRPAIDAAFGHIPRPVEYTGNTSGVRGGSSKCSYDFLLEDGSTLSLKTNTRNKVCPPEVGQPGPEACRLYFEEYLIGEEVTENSFKTMVLNHVAELIPIYVSHLFDSDYLLRLKETSVGSNKFSFTITVRETGADFKWNPELFSFSKPSIEDWNESNTVYYDGVSLGEFQVHRHRNCYKFRFNFDNLIKLING